MKQLFVLFAILGLLTGTVCFAKDCCTEQKKYDFTRDYRCSQLIQKIRAQKNTLYNVLGLSMEQQELKDEIEFRRKAEMKPYYEAYKCEKQKLRALAQTSYDTPEFKQQRKATKKAWKKIEKLYKKYDREFMKILCTTQKTKYKELVKLTKRDIKYCRLNRKACPKNPYMNTFGLNDAKNVCDVCEKHSHPHLFNRQCEFVDELEHEQ